MKTIWKFQVPVQDEFSIDLPEGAKILCFQVQRVSPKISVPDCEKVDTPHVWVLVDTDAKPVTRRFKLVGTGHDIETIGSMSYIGTVQLFRGALVYHLFEVV